jgi:hypothetical protein
MEEINRRLDKLERRSHEELLALLEIMSGANFFGEIKQTSCEYAKENQCSFFSLKKETKKLPLVSDCRINDCKESADHSHLELSNLLCTLCPILLKTSLSMKQVYEEESGRTHPEQILS